MIPAGLQTFPFNEGAVKFVPASMQGAGESLESTFAQLVAHFQKTNEGFLQQTEIQSGQGTPGNRKNSEFPDRQDFEAFLDWIQSLPESDLFPGDIDLEMVMMTVKAINKSDDTAIEAMRKTISENEGDVRAAFDFIASWMDDISDDTSIEERLEAVLSSSEQVAKETDETFVFAEEMKEAHIAPLMAIIAFVAEKSETAKPVRHPLAQYVHQLYPVGREVESQKQRDVSGRAADTGKTTEVASSPYRSEPLHATVKMEATLPKINHMTPPAAFVFNETMAMQPLNQGEQLTIHIGNQRTEHARAIDVMKQFQQALSKGHLRSDGEGRQQLTIKLYPENLGRLDVQITRDNGVLQARLVTTTAMARELVESQLPNLRHAFHQQQLPVERIVVDEAHTEVADDRREGKQSTDEDASAYEEESDEKRDEDYLPSFEEWLQATLNQEEA